MIIDGKTTRLKACRHGLMLYFKNDRYIGQALDSYGEYSESETSLFREIVSPGDIVVEAGANIGTHTLFLARAVGTKGFVHAFEPQRQIHQVLCANLALNEIANVKTYQAGLGSAVGQIDAWVPDFTVENNMGGIPLGHVDEEDCPHEVVDVFTLDGLGLQRLDLLKVDVEGMEKDVLLGARETIARCRPILYVENDRPDQSAGLIQTVFDLGYRAWWHLALFFNENNASGNPHNPFGNLISINMLCLPAEVDVQVNNMDEIKSPDETYEGKRCLAAY